MICSKESCLYGGGCFPFSVLSTPSPPPMGYSHLSQRESQLQKNITAPADCPPETGGTRSVATEGVDSLSFLFPLRPLSCVASDYSSGSVVCFWILRPLRPLHEIKIRTIVFHAKNAESAKFLFTFLFNAGAEGVANFVTTRVRREFIHPLPPAGYSLRARR